MARTSPESRGVVSCRPGRWWSTAGKRVRAVILAGRLFPGPSKGQSVCACRVRWYSRVSGPAGVRQTHRRHLPSGRDQLHDNDDHTLTNADNAMHIVARLNLNLARSALSKRRGGRGASDTGAEYSAAMPKLIQNCVLLRLQRSCSISFAPASAKQPDMVQQST